MRFSPTTGQHGGLSLRLMDLSMGVNSAKMTQDSTGAYPYD